MLSLRITSLERQEANTGISWRHRHTSSIFYWHCQGLPGWASCPPRRPKWGEKWRKFEEKSRRIEERFLFAHMGVRGWLHPSIFTACLILLCIGPICKSVKWSDVFSHDTFTHSHPDKVLREIFWESTFKSTWTLEYWWNSVLH